MSNRDSGLSDFIKSLFMYALVSMIRTVAVFFSYALYGHIYQFMYNKLGSSMQAHLITFLIIFLLMLLVGCIIHSI